MQSQAGLEIAATTSVVAFAPEGARPARTPVAYASNAVLIHVRYWPDARIWDISARPDGLSKEQWLERLMLHVGDRYQTRIGGRGFFIISPDELDRLQAAPH